MKLRLVRKQQEAGSVWSFYFEPLEPIEWTAGQSIRLEVPGAKWGVDERRFTIASAPHEAQVRITTRMSDSNFKQRLSKLKTGETIDAHAVEGSFVWGNYDGPRLFIAAGLGITPFRSMLSQAVHEAIKPEITLLYAHKELPAVFQQELDSWHTAHPSLFVRYIPEGRVDLGSNATLASYWLQNRVYISGPERMVRDISQKLIDMGVPESHILTDLFTGYPDS